MKKSFTLMYGAEEGWYWWIQCFIYEKGTFANKGAIQTQKKKSQYERHLFNIVKEKVGCMLCGEIDFRVLQTHHPFPDKDPNLTLCLCANCHAKIHWMLGGYKRFRR